MAISIVAPRGASPRAPRATIVQHHAGAHNALTLALAYLNRGDLPAARRKAVQALASIKQLEVSHG
ncbi:MAG: hypothetical protein QM586_00590 [Xenophilus sp.]